MSKEQALIQIMGLFTFGRNVIIFAKYKVKWTKKQLRYDRQMLLRLFDEQRDLREEIVSV